MTASEMQSLGEQHVKDWLEASRYSIESAQAASPDIAATGTQANLLVRVIAGEQLREISGPEKKTVVEQAAALGYKPWLAKVRLDPRGGLIGKIQWTQLN